MKKVIVLIGTWVFLLSFVCFAGNIPKLISYQGVLTDDSGTPLTGSYNLTFKIYDDTTGGNLKWSETQNGVQVQEGLFNVHLGKETALNLPFDESYWLEVQVGEETMPRLRFTSVGYAYRALIADSASVATSTPTGGGWTDDGTVIRLETNTDSVGIGTTSPDYTLQVNGTIAPEIADQDIGTSSLRWDIFANTINADKVSGDAVLDEDNMTSNSDSSLATQQSIKAYVDNQIGGSGDITAVGDVTSGNAFTTGGSGSVLYFQGTTSGELTVTAPAAAGTNTLTFPAATDILVGRATTETLTNKTLIGPVLNTSVSGDAVLDEDNMTSNSNTKLATQQSIKAYVDNQVGGAGDITAVGNVTSGNAFTEDGDGNVLYFERTTADGFEIALLGANPGADVTLTLPAATDVLVGRATTETLTNKTLIGPVLNTSVSGSAVLDEDDMTSNSNTKVATQQSIKAYVDNQVSGASDNDWTFNITDTADTTLMTGGRWGIARYGNTLYGNTDSTHVNLGVACTTGASGQNYKYCTVGGGLGNTASKDYATVGGGHQSTASGYYATVAGGNNNTASHQFTTVPGGNQNTASHQYATVGGGYQNTASRDHATVGGGYDNTASGYYAIVGGGYQNTVAGDYSAIPGGRADTITATADYSYLFGIASKLTADSTFMVDMPHVRFGDETDGYEFPTTDGTNGQVMATDGSGQLSWTTASGASDNDWTFNITDTADTTLMTGGRWGIARYGNTLYGNADSTHVNLGVACTTGTSGQNYKYCTVGGGVGNTVSSDYATVAGGYADTAAGDFSFATGNQVRLTATADYTFGFGNNFTTSTSHAAIFYDATSEMKVGIQTTSPGNIITVKQSSTTDPIADAWTTYSSKRWKTNIEPIGQALDKVERLNGVYYDWKENGKHDIGMIAEDVGEVIPEVVAYEENGVDAKSIDYARLVALLVEAMKEQQQAMNEQQQTMKEQQQQIEALKVKVEKLESSR